MVVVTIIVEMNMKRTMQVDYTDILERKLTGLTDRLNVRIRKRKN